MSTSQKILQVLSNIPNFRYVTIEKTDIDDYKAYVVDLNPNNLDVTDVEEWIGSGCGECGGCGA